MHANNEDRNFLHPRTLVITAMVLAAAAIRLAPHPMNFAPIGALALFGGAYFSSKRQALIVPLLSLIIGDAITGFHPLIPFVYASFLLSVAIGFWLRRKRSATRIGVATLAGAIQFFLVTNFAVWATSIGSYPKTTAGLTACYVAGIPFFWNTLAGDAFYAALLFRSMALAERKFPALRDPVTANAT
ncbi:MAG: hypothetical protein JWN92_3087 [Candidatus Acidoferrum typicum]|nr:hypothetical protein [Candidatus Acidoferrum typicum]